MSRLQGELAEWDDDRGFGFIQADGGDRVFVHIKSIRRIVNRPRIGDRVSFSLGTGRDGRPAAVNAEIAGANPVDPLVRRRGEAPLRPPATSLRTTLRLCVAGAIAGLVAAGSLGGRIAGWVPIFYLVAGLVGIAAYWQDKSAAESSNWRIAENTLHLIDLCFGIIGGLVAQALLRHKTSKVSFGVVTFAIAAIHLCGLAALGLPVLQQ